MRGREKVRTEIIYSLRVDDRDDGQFLGHVINISECGTMLIARQSIDVGTGVRLSIRLPRNVMQENHLYLTGEIKWRRRTHAGRYFLGVRFTDIDDETRSILSELEHRFCRVEMHDQDSEDPFLFTSDPLSPPDPRWD